MPSHEPSRAVAMSRRADSYVDLRFSHQGIAFLTDALIVQRNIESGDSVDGREAVKDMKR
jgi:hypothetical protein